MPISIKIENLSKQYRLGVIGTGTLSHDLKRWWTTSIRGKEDPYLKIGETNVIATPALSEVEVRNSKLEPSEASKPETRNPKLATQYVWALKDINLEIAQGDVVGIIGKNGAGKSTLLKILSRVTKPTTGSIQYNGRIASLLEVGTGFHPEMTGRENIYMNGAIMGMTRHEISSKLDEIIAFAGVERYIDTPVKRYSSGMTVRLGFSIAAHLEPDILVVDEVLAVGDAEFQKKAIGKMQDVSKGEGRTVLFVSHNMGAVKNLCQSAIVLENGNIACNSNVSDAIKFYLGDFNRRIKHLENCVRKGNGLVRLKEISVYGQSEIEKPITGNICHFDFLLESKKDLNLDTLRFDFRIDDYMGNRIIWLSNTLLEVKKTCNFDCLSFKINKLNLNEGIFYITTFMSLNGDITDWIQNAHSFEVYQGDYYEIGKIVSSFQSQILIDFELNYK